MESHTKRRNVYICVIVISISIMLFGLIGLSLSSSPTNMESYNICTSNTTNCTLNNLTNIFTNKYWFGSCVVAVICGSSTLLLTLIICGCKQRHEYRQRYLRNQSLSQNDDISDHLPLYVSSNRHYPSVQPPKYVSYDA